MVGRICLFLCFSFLAVSKLLVGAQGAASRFVFPAAAGHQLLFEHRCLCEPMMSCLTVGSRLGRNAPHLSDDPLRTSCIVEQRSTLRPHSNWKLRLGKSSTVRNIFGPQTQTLGAEKIQPSSSTVARLVL
jgi:hypothetical protein